MKNVSPRLILIILLGLVPLLACQKQQKDNELVISQNLNTTKALTRIAFGSCNRQNLKQPLWDDILAFDPQLWIWMGDNIYADTKNPAQFRAKYNQQLGIEAYRKLASSADVIGIWDDHDYGLNDSGREYSLKKESKTEMYRFLGVPDDDPRRDHEGAYGSYTYGADDQQVKIILLDARYFRSPLKADKQTDQRYLPNTSGTILGEAQWQWLESELTNSEAEVHLIASGIQMIPTEHWFEKWGNFPKERERLFELIKQTSPSMPILLSGDRHIAEISKYQPQGMQQSIYEITSSGMTHVYEGIEEQGEPNQYRVAGPIGRLNYGQLIIDWDSDPIRVTARICGDSSKVYLEQVVE
ncbi:MAG: alkaline phosphatase D family protein [Bacteroidota bacterium]